MKCWKCIGRGFISGTPYGKFCESCQGMGFYPKGEFGKESLKDEIRRRKESCEERYQWNLRMFQMKEDEKNGRN